MKGRQRRTTKLSPPPGGNLADLPNEILNNPCVSTKPRSATVQYQPQPLFVVAQNPSNGDGKPHNPLDMQPFLASVLISAKSNTVSSCRTKPQRVKEPTLLSESTDATPQVDHESTDTTLRANPSGSDSCNIGNSVGNTNNTTGVCQNSSEKDDTAPATHQVDHEPFEEALRSNLLGSEPCNVGTTVGNINSTTLRANLLRSDPCNTGNSTGNTNNISSVCQKSSEKDDSTQDVPHKQASWADRIINSKISPPTTLSYHLPKIQDGKISVEIDEEEFEEEISMSKEYLVGFFLGKRLPLHLVKREIDAQWPLKGSYEIMTTGDNCFYFKFHHLEDRAMVLEKGMCRIASRLFIIREWSITVEVEAESLTIVPIWVILQGFPKICRNKKGHGRIASDIGTSLFPDQVTTNGNSSSARI